MQTIHMTGSILASEFKGHELTKFVEDFLGRPGGIIGGSKSGYRREHPDNDPVFNSNIVVETKDPILQKNKYEKIWYGDIDLTLSKDKLEDLAKELGRTIYVLSEHDGRFENEETPNIQNYRYRTGI